MTAFDNQPVDFAELLSQVAIEARRLQQAGAPVSANLLDVRWLAEHRHELDVLQLIGLVLANQNRIAEAMPYYREAASRWPNHAALWVNLGELCRRAGELPVAIEHLDRGVALAPRMPSAHFNRANVLKDSGRFDEAIEAYRRAVELQANHVDAWFNLGNTLLEIGKARSARDAHLKALDLRPDRVDILQNLAASELALGEIHSALDRYSAAHRLAPEHPELEEMQGLANWRLGRGDEARQWYRAAARRTPDDWVKALRAETLIDPIAADEAAIEVAHEQVQQALDRAFAVTGAVEARAQQMSGAEPPMALAYHREEVRSVLDRYGDLFSRHLRHDPPAAARSKPHVGIVVTRGHEGVFAQCFGGIASRLASAELQVSIVCPHASASIFEQLCPEAAFRYIRLPGNLDEAARVIREAGVHLLYYWEIGTDGFNYALPYLRSAPVQVGGWGWPVTSGSTVVDYYLSATALETDQSAGEYRERLIALPSLPTFYKPPHLSGRQPARAAFGLSRDAHVYLCHQNLRKWHPRFDKLLEGICEADPQAELALIADKQPAITGRLLERLARTAPRAAARAKAISFLDRPLYFDLLATADVALDTRHYGGGANTVYDAIVVGTPMVTWPSAVHRGRWAAAALQRIGIDESIVDSAAAYVTQAVRLASDASFRELVSAKLRERGRELFEDHRPAAEYRAFFLEAIANACTS